MTTTAWSLLVLAAWLIASPVVALVVAHVIAERERPISQAVLDDHERRWDAEFSPDTEKAVTEALDLARIPSQRATPIFESLAMETFRRELDEWDGGAM